VGGEPQGKIGGLGPHVAMTAAEQRTNPNLLHGAWLLRTDARYLSQQERRLSDHSGGSPFFLCDVGAFEVQP
jgi:hypothetical protein